jgi:hypothetical protein
MLCIAKIKLHQKILSSIMSKIEHNTSISKRISDSRKDDLLNEELFSYDLKQDYISLVKADIHESDL